MPARWRGRPSPRRSRLSHPRSVAGGHRPGPSRRPRSDRRPPATPPATSLGLPQCGRGTPPPRAAARRCRRMPLPTRHPWQRRSRAPTSPRREPRRGAERRWLSHSYVRKLLLSSRRVGIGLDGYRVDFLLPSCRLAVLPSYRLLDSRLLTQPRIKRVAETAAHQVHRQRGDVDHQTGDDHVADVGAEELLRVAQHVAP